MSKIEPQRVASKPTKDHDPELTLADLESRRLGRDLPAKERAKERARREAEIVFSVRVESEARLRDREARLRDPAYLASLNAAYRRDEQRRERRSDGAFWASTRVSLELRKLFKRIEEGFPDDSHLLDAELDRVCDVRRSVDERPVGDMRRSRWRSLSDDYVRIREHYTESLRAQSHITHDTKENLERRERSLRAQLHKDRSYEHRSRVLDAETAYFESLLAPAGSGGRWVWGRFVEDGEEHVEATPVADRTPKARALPFDETRHSMGVGPPAKRDGWPTYEPPPTPAPALPSLDRTKRNDGWDARVLRVLLNHADGLSLNEIQRRLKAGRAQVTRTLDRLEHTQMVVHVGSGSDSKYIRTKQVVRRRPTKKAPKE